MKTTQPTRRGAMKKSKGMCYWPKEELIALIAECDNWKEKALAYRDIIERAKHTPAIGSHYAILNEADKLEGK